MANDDMRKGRQLSRRSFLKTVGLGSAVVAVPTIVGCAKSDDEAGGQEPPKGKMTYRTNKHTGDKVSLLGYGMMRLPTKNDHPGERQNGEGEIDQEMVNKEVDYAIEHGVNYFDTSPVYCKGKSEAATGIALSRHKRNEYFIATKMSNFKDNSREASIAMFEESLKALQVDYFDYYLWHNIGGGEDPMQTFEDRFVNNGIMDFLNQKKKEGVIRNLGFSYHGDIKIFDHALKLHDEGKVQFDFVQIEMNYLDWQHANEINEDNTDAEYLYGELLKRNLQAVIMEPLLGGRLSNLPDRLVAQLKQRDPDHSVASWSFRYVGTYPEVLTALSGMTYMEHLKQNVETFTPLRPITEEEDAFLMKMAEQYVELKTVPCTSCNYCMPCPYGLNIPVIFSYYNSCVTGGKMPTGSREAKEYWEARRRFLVGYDRNVPSLRQASHCIGCNQCVSHCPQSIDIPAELHRIDDYVEQLKRQ